MFRKLSAIVADDHFVDYLWAALPVALIILGAIAFIVIGLMKAP